MSFTVQRTTVKFSGGEFAVRGLGFDDFSALVSRHGPAIRAMFEAFSGEAGLAGAAEKLLISAPRVAADVLRFAADDAAGEYERLPLSVAIEGLQAVGKLTFEGEDALKNVLAFLESAVREVGSVMQPSA